jgi:pimeloyl-ACP methyl ester carboxylesterase
MFNDRMNKTLTLEDGRRLGFAEYGTLSGRPVFHFHGSASSRFERPASPELLDRLGVHFISLDRPGHGLSDYQPDRRLVDWPRDISQLADHLGIGEFYVSGYSAGGPHALVCAHQLADRVLAGAAVSCMAPMDRPGAYEGMPLPNQMLARSARRFPPLTKLLRRITRGMILDDPEKAVRRVMSSVPESDKAVLYAPENVEIFSHSLREGFRQGYQGVAQDDILVNRDWGFDPRHIRPRIDIWHGDADVNVPVHAGKFLNDVLPHTNTVFLPGEGHFFLLKSWEQILSKFFSEV